MVRSCHRPEVHAMFANTLIQGSKLKKTLNLRLSKFVGKNAWAKSCGRSLFQAYNIYLKTNSAQDSNFI